MQNTDKICIILTSTVNIKSDIYFIHQTDKHERLNTYLHR